MTRYDKFNFVFFLNPMADYYKFMFYDAFALSNVRFIELGTADADSRTSLAFRPYRPANNPAAFIQNFDVNAPQTFAQDFPTDAPVIFFFWANEYKMFRDYDFFISCGAIIPNAKWFAGSPIRFNITSKTECSSTKPAPMKFSPRSTACSLTIKLTPWITE